MTRKAEQGRLILVAAAEATYVKQEVVELTPAGLQRIPIPPSSWDCTPFLTDPTGLRLAEEMVRRVRTLSGEIGKIFDNVVVTLPGTLESHTTVLRSTRLGIREAIDLAAEFKRLGAPQCHVFHDTECLALGEARHGALRGASLPAAHESFAYILVDEGVGSTIFIDGKVLKGAGSAGHLGRLVVEPDGAYNKTFASRGPLEVFAARPWISQHIVGEYLAEQGKQGAKSPSNNAFRATVAAAAEKDWSALTVRQVDMGMKSEDPIVLTVLENAAQYLGLAVNAVITIVNPPSIVLGGAMIEQLPGFADKIISYARRFSWRLAWNRTTISIATLGRDAQVLGAVEMLKDVLHPVGQQNT
ncbi:ROK family protein [Catellatospora sichuanensis]|uniref:ROK family protein n=1 Tax=Catellatospora sichuanensis TaxID=1969805 RepID=UPI001183BC5F|nr:ROK family protein [Catellatospora sichuanensis]